MNKIVGKFSGKRITDLIFFIPLFLLCLYLSYDINFLNRRSGLPEIRSDKAHYYVYLPATFIYHWDASKFPPNIDYICSGFGLDKKNNKVVIKTTCGVAILWAPFFLATHFIAVHWNLKPDGFSDFYERMTVIPGVFYLVLGLFFLRRFLGKYFTRKISYITVLLIFAGTNLYFFGIDDGLMSHVNSFFLFSLFLFLLKKFLDDANKSFGLFLGLSIALSLAILVRPTNILLISWMAFLDVRSWKEIIPRIRLFLNPWYILIFLVTLFIVFLPQFLYWHYLSGHFVWYSYPGENFSNWNHPQLIRVWFSTLNGYFLYTPLALFCIAGIFVMIMKKVPNGIFLGLSFLLTSYIFASWWSWFFGGSFGYRPLVEYFALLSFPFAYFIDRLWKMRNLYFKSIFIVLILCSVYYNLRMTYHTRWNTSSVWAWDDYIRYMEDTGMYSWPGRSYTYIQDFENFGVPEVPPVRTCVHSPVWASYIAKSIEFNRLYSERLDLLLKKPVQKVDASVWINPGRKTETGIRFVCRIVDSQNKIYYDKNIKVDDFLKGEGKWYRISATFKIPEWVDQSNSITFLIWNPAKTDTTYIDDLKLRFE